MSVHPFGVLAGDVGRREMLGALARWTVPTVLTMTLVTRQAQAVASCPPCTQKTGGRCRSCTMNQILNCQCEPCLGAPYCANGARAAAARPGQMTAPRSGLIPGGYGAPSPLSPSSAPDLMNPYFRTLRDRPAFSGRNPFDLQRSPSLPGSPFGGSGDYGVPADTGRSRGGLYDRLRRDPRRPF